MAKTQPIDSWNAAPYLGNYVDKIKPYLTDDFTGAFSPDVSSTPVYSEPTKSSPIPYGLDEEQLKNLNYFRAQLPYQLDAVKQASDFQANLAYDQMVKNYPLMQQAATEAEARSRAGAKDWLAFKEGQPTSDQTRRSMAAGAEVARAEAMAAQTNAAANMASVNYLRGWAGRGIA